MTASPDYDKAFNTLAVVEAERGELHSAKTNGWKAMELDHRGKPSGADWYVVGRIAEQLGLRDDALSAYKRVAPNPRESFPTPYELAQRRMRALARP